MRINSRKILTVILTLLLAASVFIVKMPRAQSVGVELTGKVLDRGVDTDGDGLFNYLEISVEVNVTEPGLYVIDAGGLRDSAYNYVTGSASWNYTESYLNLGFAYLNVSFPGVSLYVSGVNITYVESINLLDEEWNNIENLVDTPLSREYYYTEFDPPNASMTRMITDNGVDGDGNGLFDYLEIGVEVNVTEPGLYHIDIGGLRDPSYNYVDVWNYTEEYLEVGIGHVNVSLIGMNFYISGVNVSHIGSIELFDEEMNNIGSLNDAPLSRTYSYTEFEIPSASMTGAIQDQGVDIDEDGVYNYLEIGVEVQVSEAGEYMVDAYGLMDGNYEYIDVGDSQSVHLDTGIQVVCLSFDGATIYTSGLNPTSISHIALYDQDHNFLGNLYEIPLSRTYSYTEFEIPVPMTVGVEVGDWAVYGMIVTWQSTDPTAIEPREIEEARQVEWIKVEVQSVSGTHITILQTHHYENGTDEALPLMAADVGTQFLMQVIPSDLAEGDMIAGYAEIIGTMMKNYAGVSRQVNYINLTTSFLDTNMTQIMHWDKATGILCEMLIETGTLADGYVTTASYSMNITETNLWTALPTPTPTPSPTITPTPTPTPSPSPSQSPRPSPTGTSTVSPAPTPIPSSGLETDWVLFGAIGAVVGVAIVIIIFVIVRRR